MYNQKFSLKFVTLTESSIKRWEKEVNCVTYSCLVKVSLDHAQQKSRSFFLKKIYVKSK